MDAGVVKTDNVRVMIGLVRSSIGESVEDGGRRGLVAGRVAGRQEDNVLASN